MGQLNFHNVNQLSPPPNDFCHCSKKQRRLTRFGTNFIRLFQKLTDILSAVELIRFS
jgi:hypothetical protein